MLGTFNLWRRKSYLGEETSNANMTALHSLSHRASPEQRGWDEMGNSGNPLMFRLWAKTGLVAGFPNGYLWGSSLADIPSQPAKRVQVGLHKKSKFDRPFSPLLTLYGTGVSWGGALTVWRGLCEGCDKGTQVGALAWPVWQGSWERQQGYARD